MSPSHANKMLDCDMEHCPSPGDWLHIAQTYLGQAFATLRFSIDLV